MAGIIITPGTFNPPATPFQSAGIYRFPKTPVVTLRRKWLQYATAGPGGEVAPPETPYDDSAMVVAAVDIWVADPTKAGSVTIWRAARNISMGLQWRDLPPEVTAVKINGAEEPVATGSATVDVAESVFVTDDYLWFDPADGEDLWEPVLNGQDFTATGVTNHGDYVYASGPKAVNVRTGGADSLIVRLMSGATEIGGYYISPVYTTTTRLRSASPATVSQLSPRSMRLRWTPELGYQLQVPAGFIYSAL
jgi:hypothetical protein